MKHERKVARPEKEVKKSFSGNMARENRREMLVRTLSALRAVEILRVVDRRADVGDAARTWLADQAEGDLEEAVRLISRAGTR